MRDKLLVIISSSDQGKALTGMMYAVNAMLHGWMNDVQLFFFGPAEELLTKDKKIQEYLQQYSDMKGEAIACRVIAERDGTDSALSELGVRVDYVGEQISDLIKSGYTPLVW